MHILTRVSTIATLTVLALTMAASDADTFSPAEMPLRWEYVPEHVQDAVLDRQWWSAWGDPVLDSLIAIALDQNYDVLMAMRKLDIARQKVRGARSSYYPTVAVSGAWNYERDAGAISGKHTKSSNSRYWGIVADASWEADIWGRIRDGVKEKQADYRATRADLEGVLVSVAAEVASVYITLRQLQLQEANTRCHILSQDTILQKVEARYAAGLVAQYDVSQSKIVYYSTQASLPDYDTQIREAVNSIAVLSSITPDHLSPLLALPDDYELPDPSTVLAVEAPADLLRRRPDIAAAEATLAADAAAIGVARKEFLPTLTIEGTIGTYERDLRWIGRGNSWGWSVAPTLSWTIFDGWSRDVTLAEAKLQLQSDIDNYNLTVVTAVQEVDNALVSYRNYQEESHWHDLCVKESIISFREIVEEYLSGLADYTDVASAQIDWLTYSNDLLSCQGSSLQSLITLYKAMGGGIIDNNK